MKNILILILVILSNITYGGTRDPNTPDSKYVEYGSKYKCVVRIKNINKDKMEAFASAVVIKPTWVLTAAHVVDETTNNVIILDSNDEIEVVEIFIPKEFNDEFGNYDIALCKLNSKINLDFYPELYEKNDEVGKVAGIAGFGVTGTFSSSERISGSVRRAGSNKIDEIDRQLLICGASIQNKTELEFIIYHGDSGGGLFINQQLAGINSCVLATDKKPDGSYGDQSGHTRVSIHRNWIKEKIK